MPKFSVVISVYNKGDFIKKTLESVLQQSYHDYEIIVVNDASSDHSETVIQSINNDKLTYHAFLENKGAAAARNKGIELATGTYIALLDGDDLWHKGYLQEISTLINTFPGHSVFATAITIQEYDSTRESRYTFSNPDNKKHLSLNYFKSSLKNTLLTSSSTVIKKTAFLDIGCYDTSFKSGEDTDLWIRIGIKYPIAFSTTPFTTYSYVSESLDNSTRSVINKANFVAYESIEKENKALKKFLDLNRFSLAVRAKLWKEPKESQSFINRIDFSNLSKKQQCLLQLPAPIIRLLFLMKRVLEKLGIRLSVF